MDQKVWDEFAEDCVEMPAEMLAFLRDIEAVCRKHGFSIGHEDGGVGFQVHLFSEENLRWLTGASKSYTKEVDPETGKMFAPKYMGDSCPLRDVRCASCRFLSYCFPEWSLQVKKKWAEFIVRQVAGNMALSGMNLTDADKERIRYFVEHPEEEDAIVQGLIEKHTRRNA